MPDKPITNNHIPQSPEMTVIANRPVKVVRHLTSSEGVLVACRLASGEDVHVPLHALFSLFAGELAAKVRMEQGVKEV